MDPQAIDWACRHLPGRFESIASSPPTRLPSEHFDVVYAISVFTHFDEASETAWLAELHRVLRPGGLFLATTLSPSLSWQRPDMSISDRERLEREGTVFLKGGGEDFNEETAFHSNDYLKLVWGRLFGQRLFLERGAAGYQDLSVWVKWE